jgi:hypothetical protein
MLNNPIVLFLAAVHYSVTPSASIISSFTSLAGKFNDLLLVFSSLLLVHGASRNRSDLITIAVTHGVLPSSLGGSNSAFIGLCSFLLDPHVGSFCLSLLAACKLSKLVDIQIFHWYFFQRSRARCPRDYKQLFERNYLQQQETTESY